MKKTSHFKGRSNIFLGLVIVLVTLFSINFVMSADVYDAHGKTLSSTSEDVVRLAGTWFFANKDVTLKEITIYTSMNPTYCELGNASGRLQIGSVPSDDNSTFNYELIKGQKYYVACNGSATWGRNNTGCGGVSTGTINKTNINYSEGYLGGYAGCSGRSNTYDWVVNTIGIRTGEDEIPPSVTINSPANTTYLIGSLISFNITATDPKNINSCKYSLDNWITNTTLTQNGNYFTGSSVVGIGNKIVRYSCKDNSTFQNENNTESRSFTIAYVNINGVTYSSSVVGDSNQTFILNFSYSNLFNSVTAILNYNGVNYSSSVNYESTSTTWCYQESANVSNQNGTDGSCGQIYDGSYGGQSGYTTLNKSSYDGDYTNYASGDILYINYTIPLMAVNATWRVKDNSVNGDRNDTLPHDCFDKTNGKLELQLFSLYGNLYNYCRNNTGWKSIRVGYPGDYFYEEGINWKISGNNNTLATSYAVVPNPTANTNYTFFWYLLQNNITGTYLTNTNSYTQLVTTQPSINITTYPCSSPQFEALNFSWKDQEDLTDMTDMIITYNFKYGITNTSSIESYGTYTNDTLRICIPNNTNNYQIGYAEITYRKGDYETLKYYLFTNYTLSNVTTDQQILYDLPSNESTSFLVTIKDKRLNPYVNKLIVLLRWYPSINSYKVVEMSKTDQNGQAPIHVHTEDVDYRLAVYELNGTLINLQSPVRMLCLVNPCSYDISLQDTGNDYFYVYNIQSNLSWNNDTKTFTYIWNDPSQYVSMMSLIITKENGFSSSLLCNTSSTGYIGVLDCYIGGETGLIKASVYKTASPETIFEELIIRIGTIIPNQVGLFFSFVLGLVGALIGIFSPVGAILFMLVGLLFSLFIGSISLTFFIGIGSLGGIVFYFIKKAQRTG